MFGTVQLQPRHQGILSLGMATITVQVDPDTLAQLQQRARERGVSVEALIAELLQQWSRAEWHEVVRQLTGVWQDDFPEPDELRRALEVESPREQP
ncbi:Ribbon-helix-helix protein, copG family [Armatimonadetes bacterium DC]|nr:Ribbon-helix-helix protein, copG family [Armatimonadetes bacterium DC]